MIAKIAVSAANFAIDKPYSYRIPEEMTVKPGQRVQLPFGRANKRTEGVVLAVESGIIAKEAIAQKAIPACNITYIDGEEMKQALSGYLGVLFEQDPKSVGGALPEDAFYYVQ